MRIAIRFFFFILALCLMSSCEDPTEKVEAESATTWITKKVAVVLPMSNGQDKHWKRTLNQCAEDLEEAFYEQEIGIKLEYEWYDEDTEDISALADVLSQRSDVVAVIGGVNSDNALSMADKFSKNSVQKPFFTVATTQELIRKYAGSMSPKCVWALTTVDIKQCELLLFLSYFYGAKTVALLVDEQSKYGDTFTEWYSQKHVDFSLVSYGIYEYESGEVAKSAREAGETGADYLICVPSKVSDIRIIEETMAQLDESSDNVPERLYSDIAYSRELLDSVSENRRDGIEGIAIGADPNSGFDTRYEVMYDELPLEGEAHIYDAAMMVAYASFLQQKRNISSLNESIKKLVDGRDEYNYTPTTDGMRDFVTKMASGENPNLRGVSGALDFNSNVYTNVLSSTYYHFGVFQGKHIIVDYYDDSYSRSSSYMTVWQMKTENMQDVDRTYVDTINYPNLDKKWALLVAAPSGAWEYYRFQADVFWIYQYLKKNGYDDDHIILITEDDIAYNSSNKLPGTIYLEPGGENVHTDVQVDYKVSELSPSDIKSILCGERSDRLPKVIESDEDDNIFFFWSGHGSAINNSCQLQWGELTKQGSGFTRDMANEVFRAMYEKKCYRKFLCMVEACYSGGVFNAVEGYPGMLAFTAARGNETSSGIRYDKTMETLLTNMFTMNFQECMKKNPKMSLRELYYELYVNTVGSHVTLFNNYLYGNMNQNSMEEFVVY